MKLKLLHLVSSHTHQLMETNINSALACKQSRLIEKAASGGPGTAQLSGDTHSNTPQVACNTS